MTVGPTGPGELPLGLTEPAATAVVVAALVGLNVAGHLFPSPLWLGPAVAAALLGFARWTGLTWAQLGLGWDKVRPGLRWGLGAVAVIGGAYLVGVLLPPTRQAFLDVRYHLDVPRALFVAFVVIPLGTILVEEIAFRSVLWAMLARHTRSWRVLVTSSALFGLWHVLPSLHLTSANSAVGNTFGTGWKAELLAVAGAVALTAVGGVVAGELRRRSGSVLASAGMHWATNSLGVLFGLLAWRMAR